ncbi:MAG: heme exporter protein A [Bacteroidia bacterium]|jgi:heme exporter protein A
MLTVKNITLERYFEPVFEPLSFTVSSGEILLLTGDNGSGKTTLIRILAGVLQASEGEVSKSEADLVYVGHQLAVKDDLSVSENIDFMREFLAGSDRSTADIVTQVGLQRVAGQVARTLSAGQRKRCALARLLLSPARLWLLDEPYSNLDRNGIAMLDGLLRQHVDAGGACVLTTHGSLRPAGFEMQECELISGSRAA